MKTHQKCQRCFSKRVLAATGKCSDMFGGFIDGLELEGYVPDGLNIGGGDYIEFDVCLDCGQMQGVYPLPISEHEKDISDEDIAEFFDNHFMEGGSADVPAFRHREIINAAEYLSHRFRKFVSNYLSCNSTMRPHKFAIKHPSVTRFIQMYRDNYPYIEE